MVIRQLPVRNDALLNLNFLLSKIFLSTVDCSLLHEIVIPLYSNALYIFNIYIITYFEVRSVLQVRTLFLKQWRHIDKGFLFD